LGFIGGPYGGGAGVILEIRENESAYEDRALFVVALMFSLTY
jgi:hypothetical protein